MNRRRGTALFYALLVALVAANVVVYVVFPSHHGSRRSSERAHAQGKVAGRTPPRSHAKGGTATRHRRHATKPRRRAAPHALVVTADGGPTSVVARRGSASGQSLYEGVLATGGRLRFTGPSVYLRLGAVSNAQITLDGRPLDLRCSAAGGVLVTQGVAVAVGPPTCAGPSS